MPLSALFSNTLQICPSAPYSRTPSATVLPSVVTHHTYIIIIIIIIMFMKI
jgi:hypothetical protein